MHEERGVIMFKIKGKHGYVKKLKNNAWIFTKDIFYADTFHSKKDARLFIEKHKIETAQFVYFLAC